MDTKAVSSQSEIQNTTNKNGASQNGVEQNGRTISRADQIDAAAMYYPPPPTRLLPSVPTFSLEEGWRLVYDEETDTTYRIPLTLADFLYPTEDDIGFVYMSHSQTHDLIISLLVEMLRLYLGDLGWYFPHDVLTHWDEKSAGSRSKSPDISAIPNTKASTENKPSFKVGEDGPLPAVVFEVTSRSTRRQDFDLKPTVYAAEGIPEYLIIDTLNDPSEPWKLYGYRLGDSPYYDEIEPDAEGGIEIDGLGLRFVPHGREQIQVYDSKTGERLLSAAEFKAAAIAETERADAEAKRADTAEAQLEALQARLRELESNSDKEIQ